ncbi:MAG: hypothetical protein ACMXYG_01920 [Candidatus Woesearchaeota archaeon]
METEQKPERQTAKIASIKEIVEGKYYKQEGWEPNYVLTTSNEKISRVNILGIVVTVPEKVNSMFIDDGSNKIEVRSFEDGPSFSNYTIGDIVLIIGRPREYNDEIYINAEIVRKIENKGWLEYRKKQISLKQKNNPSIITSIDEKKSEINEVEPELDIMDTIILKIKELDKGDGCFVSELSKYIDNPDATIEKLLLKGEIFEISPGKVKVLE